MKEQKNLPVRRHRKRRKHRLWLRALPHVVLIAGCLAIIVSITGSVFGKESIPDEIVSNEMISRLIQNRQKYRPWIRSGISHW